MSCLCRYDGGGVCVCVGGGGACAYELQYLGLGSAASVDTMEEGRGRGGACVYELQY